MHRSAYAETSTDSPTYAREQEREAFRHAIVLMQKAVSAGPDAAETQAALAFLQQLWVILIDDLSRPDNALPDALKAKLISIGIFVMKEIEEVRRTRSNDLQPLIDISSLIEQGLN